MTINQLQTDRDSRAGHGYLATGTGLHYQTAIGRHVFVEHELVATFEMGGKRYALVVVDPGLGEVEVYPHRAASVVPPATDHQEAL